MAFALHQLSVSSLLDQPAVLQDQDQVEILHRGEVVSDDDCGLTTEQTFERVVNQRFRFGVNGRRRLVEDQHRQALDDRASQTDALPLAFMAP